VSTRSRSDAGIEGMHVNGYLVKGWGPRLLDTSEDGCHDPFYALGVVKARSIGFHDLHPLFTCKSGF